MAARPTADTPVCLSPDADSGRQLTGPRRTARSTSSASASSPSVVRSVHATMAPSFWTPAMRGPSGWGAGRRRISRALDRPRAPTGGTKASDDVTLSLRATTLAPANTSSRSPRSSVSLVADTTLGSSALGQGRRGPGGACSKLVMRHTLVTCNRPMAGGESLHKQVCVVGVALLRYPRILQPPLRGRWLTGTSGHVLAAAPPHCDLSSNPWPFPPGGRRRQRPHPRSGHPTSAARASDTLDGPSRGR